MVLAGGCVVRLQLCSDLGGGAPVWEESCSVFH